MKISSERKAEYKKLLVVFLFCFSQSVFAQQKIITGAEQISTYFPLIKGKNIGLVVNQTSVVGNTHLVDTLLKLKVAIKGIFAPEHGFRGDHGAGVYIKNSKDKKTGLNLISLYGEHKKPTKEDFKGIQIVLFDIQDVGARFYTYISTLHYVMEACAEHKIPVIILDRPNPNGFYVDGPILEQNFSSFVGMHPIPVVHGLTIGEYANMINGERWLKDSLQCKVTIVKMQGYDHTQRYELPIKPSPNLPNISAVNLYPSLCFFEGTNYSIGRGTDNPFECVGKPQNNSGNFIFTPKSIPGVAENPPYKGQLCKGYLLSEFSKSIFQSEPRLYLDWLIQLYQEDTSKNTFFNPFFDKLAGTDLLRKQIVQGKTEQEIRDSWEPNLNKFRKKRATYLLYKDFTYYYQRESK